MSYVCGVVACGGSAVSSFGGCSSKACVLLVGLCGGDVRGLASGGVLVASLTWATVLYDLRALGRFSPSRRCGALDPGREGRVLIQMRRRMFLL
jgi:hypothetical protein